jgi:hypothetical protein
MIAPGQEQKAKTLSQPGILPNQNHTLKFQESKGETVFSKL